MPPSRGGSGTDRRGGFSLTYRTYVRAEAKILRERRGAPRKLGRLSWQAAIRAGGGVVVLAAYRPTSRCLSRPAEAELRSILASAGPNARRATLILRCSCGFVRNPYVNVT